MYYIVVNEQEAAMPEGTNSMPVSLRVPAELIETLDKIAAVLERSRSWVMLRALRQYIADEGQEVLDIREGIAEADRGELIPFDEVMAEAREIIARAEAKRGTS